MIFAKSSLLAVMVLATGLSSGLAAAEPAAAEPAAAELAGHEIAGHWLATGYLEALERTRSPIAAAAASDLVALLVDRDREQLGEGPAYFLSVTSFHEGLNYRIRRFEQKGRQAVIEADSLDDDSGASQKVLLELMPAPDGGRLAAGKLWGEERLIFRRLPGTVQEFVNRLTVAGSYQDGKGKSYELAPDGKLVWAGEMGSYEVVIDTYENGCDVVSRSLGGEGGETAYTGFRRENGGGLAFYELLEGEEQEHLFECAKKPFLVLSPKN